MNTYSVYLMVGHDGTPNYYGHKPDGALGPNDLVVEAGLPETRAIAIEIMLSKSLAKDRTLQ